MNKLICTKCGSYDFLDANDHIICKNCKAEYSFEEVRAMAGLSGSCQDSPVDGAKYCRTEAHYDEVNAESTAVDNEGVEASTEETDNFVLADSAYKANDLINAELYADKALETDPNDPEALIIKAKAAAWQSTLSRSRIEDLIIGYTQALKYIADDEKDKLEAKAKKDVRNVYAALVRLACDEFSIEPTDIKRNQIAKILSQIDDVANMCAKYELDLTKDEIEQPLSAIINQAAVQAYQEVIEPKFSGGENKPDDNALKVYLAAMGDCIKLLDLGLKYAVDDDVKVILYENEIFFHEKSVNACSYIWRDYDFSQKADASEITKNGGILAPEKGGVWLKYHTLSQEAIGKRKDMIAELEQKIEDIRSPRIIASNITNDQTEEDIERIKPITDFENKDDEKNERSLPDNSAVETKIIEDEPNEEPQQDTADKEEILAELKEIEQQKENVVNKANSIIEQLNARLNALSSYKKIEQLDSAINDLNLKYGECGTDEEKQEIQDRIDQTLKQLTELNEQIDNKKQQIKDQIERVKSTTDSKLDALDQKAEELKKQLK